MFRIIQQQMFFVLRIALVAIFALACARAEAQVKPLRITGGGNAPVGLPLVPLTPAAHDATGVATELGMYRGAGLFQLLNYTGPLSAQFSSAPDFTFVGANGDKLVMTYGVVSNGARQPGQVTLTPNADGSLTAVFVAEFNPVIARCTGRFANLAGGSLIMVAVSSPFFVLGANTTPFTYTWQGEGQLVYGGNLAAARRQLQRMTQPNIAAIKAQLLRAQMARAAAARQASPPARRR